MIGSSVILLTVAILFLRNQIRPILRLAEAADAFGKGRRVPDDFRPRGAREVRQAATAFLEMRDRITTHVEQRTTMLAGVSHDLRTILTRFKLELALLGDTPEAQSLQSDVREMQDMLEDYLAFAKGDGGEESAPTNLRELLEEVHDEAQILRHADRAQAAQAARGAGAAAEAPGLQARHHQPRLERGALRRSDRSSAAPSKANGCASRSTTTAPASRRPSAPTCSSRSTGSTTRAIRTRATPASASPSRATSPRATAATSRSGESSMGGLRAIISVPAVGQSQIRPDEAARRAGLVAAGSAAVFGSAAASAVARGSVAARRWRSRRLRCRRSTAACARRAAGAGRAPPWCLARPGSSSLEPGAIDGGVDRAEACGAHLPVEPFAADAGGAQHPRLRLTQRAHAPAPIHRPSGGDRLQGGLVGGERRRSGS